MIRAEFYEDAFHREKVRHKGEAWEQYFNDKCYTHSALRLINSYSMALIDEPESGAFAVDQYSFAPRPNLETEAIFAMKETQKIFEGAGFKVDLWMQDEGSLGPRVCRALHYMGGAGCQPGAVVRRSENRIFAVPLV